MTKEKKLLAHASWHEPTLGMSCPKCNEWDNHYKRFAEMEYPFEICQSTEREELKGLEFKCSKCKAVFELEDVEW